MKPYGRRRGRSYSRKITAQPRTITKGEPKKPAYFFARLWAIIKGLFK